jgi:GrpB-like predicted nucleotidyltransferase (UPF0157 family)
MDKIEIVEYDPRWPQLFCEEAERINTALSPNLVLSIEHFGSTAVPGLAAKPIIDIVITVPSLELARLQAIGPLEKLGYIFWRENPKTDRLFFVKGMPPYGERRTHHIHLTGQGGEMRQHLIFRDYLRTDPGEVLRYAKLKRKLAAKYPEDREAYTEAKNSYIAAVMQKAARLGTPKK